MCVRVCVSVSVFKKESKLTPSTSSQVKKRKRSTYIFTAGPGLREEVSQAWHFVDVLLMEGRSLFGAALSRTACPPDCQGELASEPGVRESCGMLFPSGGEAPRRREGTLPRASWESRVPSARLTTASSAPSQCLAQSSRCVFMLRTVPLPLGTGSPVPRLRV